MAPSYINSMLLALVVTFAVAAPSTAARDGGAVKVAAAPAPSASDEVLHPTGLIDGIIDGFGQIIGEIPDLPLPRILPCPPAFPIKIPLIPCYNATTTPPPVTECRTSLAKYMPPCADYLTNGSSEPLPPKKCCAGVRSMMHGGDSMRPLCLCHVMNGDADKLYQAPVNHARALSMFQPCGFGLAPDDVSSICSDNEIHVPPMDAPPPSQGTNNAGSP